MQIQSKTSKSLVVSLVFIFSVTTVSPTPIGWAKEPIKSRLKKDAAPPTVDPIETSISGAQLAVPRESSTEFLATNSVLQAPTSADATSETLETDEGDAGSGSGSGIEITPGPGDFDVDGDVDGDDFLVWQSGFGMQSGATHADGDADHDGDVDGDDFLIWQSNMGNTYDYSEQRVLFFDENLIGEGIYYEEWAQIRVSADLSREEAQNMLLNAGYQVSGNNLGTPVGNFFTIRNPDPSQSLTDSLTSLANLEYTEYVMPLLRTPSGEDYGQFAPGTILLFIGGYNDVRTIEEIDSVLSQHNLVIQSAQLVGPPTTQLLEIIVRFDPTQYTNEQMANLLIDSGDFIYIAWSQNDYWAAPNWPTG